jgi:hypothetical protein
MQIKVQNENGKTLYIGCAEFYLELQENDTELELMLNALDCTTIQEVYYGDLCIEKVLELIYD